jgi:hypothetical protein
MAVPTLIIDAALKRCLNGPYLSQDPSKPAQAAAELDTARTFYTQAEQSFQAQDEATGLKQAWGAIFRAARALVYAAGYNVDSIRCLEVALEAHYLDRGLTIEDLQAVRKAQELVGPASAALARASSFLDKTAYLLANRGG